MRALFAVLAIFVATRPLSGEPPVPPCIRFSSEARYRPFGYDHVVHIRSSCATDARCKVATDVNPEPVEATVPARTEIEVITWAGSPSREFTPQLTCSVAHDQRWIVLQQRKPRW